MVSVKLYPTFGQYTVRCSNCNAVAIEIGERAEAHKHLLDCGWSYLLSKKSFCPECSNKIKRGELSDE